MTSRTFTWTVPDGDGMGHIPVSFDQRALFGQARPPVVVTINGHTYRSTISVMNGETFVPLRRTHRELADVAAGQVIEVTLTLDTAPRVAELPADLAAAVDAAAAREAWDKLSFSRQRECVEAVEGAKKAETRARRVAATAAALAKT